MSRRVRPGRTPLTQLLDDFTCVVFGHLPWVVPGRPVVCVHCGRPLGAPRRRRGGHR